MKALNKIELMAAVFVFMTSAAAALDISYDTSLDQSIKKDKSMSVKKGSEQKSSNRKFDTNTDAKSSTADITFDPMPIYKLKANRCVQSIAVAADFGLSAVIDDEDGIIDLNRKAYIDNAASSAMRISAISGVKEKRLKEYIGCIINESAKMAQSNLNLQNVLGSKAFSSRQVTRAALKEFESIETITDPSIRMQFIQAYESLKQPCRFIPNQAKDSVQCGSLVFSFTDNSIRNAGTTIAGAGALFGVSPSFRISLSDTDSDGKETSHESSQSSSRDASLVETGSDSMNRASKKTTNASPFLPK